MLEFVARMFKGFVNVMLWLILISSTILGFLTFGNMGGYEFHFGLALLGVIVGGLAGLVVTVLSGGFVANFLNMVSDIEAIKEHLRNIRSTSSINSPQTNSPQTNLSNVSPVRSFVNNSGDTWVCKKCSERNPVTSPACKSCGSYK